MSRQPDAVAAPERQVYAERLADVAGLQDELTGALIGLARAAAGNAPATQDTWRLMIEGLFTAVTNVNFNEETIRELICQVRAEKDRLIPNCAACVSRCGHNDDYDMKQLWNAQEDVRSPEIADFVWRTRHGGLCASCDGAGIYGR